MSTIKVANVRHPDASAPAITLASDGSVSIPSLPVSPFAFGYAGTAYFTTVGANTFTLADPLGTGDIGLKAVRVRLVGGGGGGGGGTTDKDTPLNHGGGGAGGAYAERFIPDLSGVEATVVADVGAAGAGGGSNFDNGNPGGASSFTSTALAQANMEVSANGGAGGASESDSVGGNGGGIAKGGDPTSTAVGDLVIPGGPGSPSVLIYDDVDSFDNLAHFAFPFGGQSHLSAPQTAGITASIFGRFFTHFPGIDGLNYGGGGSGGWRIGDTVTGGNGAPGIVIVDCFV